MAAGDIDDLEALEPMARLLVSHLRRENADLREQLARNAEQLSKNSELIQRLTEQVEALNHRLFGKRSEKIPSVREELRQQVAPGELTVDGDPMPEQPEARAKEKRRKARKSSEPARQTRRQARKDIPTIIEVREVQAEALPEGYTLADFRVVGDGKVLHRVEHVAEHLVIQKYVLQTLASKDGQHVITAEAPAGVIDGGHYGPSLHAHVAVTRGDDSIPLYRSERALARAGYPIARSTLCTLFHRVAEQLAPLYQEMRSVVRRSRYVNADETGQRILDKDECLRGWMWVMLSRQAVVYHYSDSRDAVTANALLGGTSGNLTIDGYAAYNGLSEKTASRLRSGCWGHCRRKFFEAMPVDSVDHENRELLGMVTELYRIEDEAASRGIEGTPEHLELRQRKSAPIVKKIWRWVDARDGKHSPKSKMGAALTYATKQRDNLSRFLHDPKLPLDNNVAERALRIVALGRKNSLFAGSAEHAQNLAIIQSVIATCRMHAVNPYDYIRHMLIEIQSHPAARIAELMPWRWHPSGA
jgi:transposase